MSNKDEPHAWTPLETVVMERCYAAGIQVDDVEEDPNTSKVLCTRFGVDAVLFMNELRTANLQVLGYVRARDAHVWVRPLAPLPI